MIFSIGDTQQNIITKERKYIKKKIHYLSHNRALTTTMVGLNPKSTEVVLVEKVKEINSKESIGWSWVLLAVASIHF